MCRSLDFRPKSSSLDSLSVFPCKTSTAWFYMLLMECPTTNPGSCSWHSLVTKTTSYSQVFLGPRCKNVKTQWLLNRGHPVTGGVSRMFGYIQRCSGVCGEPWQIGKLGFGSRRARREWPHDARCREEGLLWKHGQTNFPRNYQHWRRKRDRMEAPFWQVLPRLPSSRFQNDLGRRKGSS